MWHVRWQIWRNLSFRCACLVWVMYTSAWLLVYTSVESRAFLRLVINILGQNFKFFGNISSFWQYFMIFGNISSNLAMFQVCLAISQEAGPEKLKRQPHARKLRLFCDTNREEVIVKQLGRQWISCVLPGRWTLCSQEAELLFRPWSQVCLAIFQFFGQYFNYFGNISSFLAILQKT